MVEMTLDKIHQHIPALRVHPRADLGVQPTSIDELSRLGSQYGIRLLAKRDDTSALAMGGNKVRQLEYYLGPAARQDTDTVLITGAVQSNFVRLCAAAAAKLGWRAVVQLEHRVKNENDAYNNSGNVLLDRLLGAEIHYFNGGNDEDAADESLDELAESQRRLGFKPYVVHLGVKHPPLGGLGYVQCAVESYLQLHSNDQLPDHVVIPSGSGLTHAGFLIGARAIAWNVPVHGICVRRDATQQQARIVKRSHELNSLLENAASINDNDVLTDDSVLAPGYGQLNDRVVAAIKQSASTEALLLDPVYSGRAMAGLFALIERGVIKSGQTVLFVHTGGLPGIFAYQDELNAAIA